MDLPEDLAAELAAFGDRLASATDLGAATRDKYRRNTAAFLTWLTDAREAGALDGDPLTDPAARDWAVRDWRRTLKNTRTKRGTHLGAATINNRLAAVDAFFALRGSGRPTMARPSARTCCATPSAPTSCAAAANSPPNRSTWSWWRS